MIDLDYYHNVSIIITVEDAQSFRETGLIVGCRLRNKYVVEWDDGQTSSPLDKEDIDVLIEGKNWAILL
jgi:hypothetical protein